MPPMNTPISATATKSPMINPPGAEPKIAPNADDGNTPSDDPNNEAPIQLDFTMKVAPSEAAAAVDLLKEAGFDDIAKALETALGATGGQGGDQEDDATKLQNEIIAEGNSAHSGMNMQ